MQTVKRKQSKTAKPRMSLSKTLNARERVSLRSYVAALGMNDVVKKLGTSRELVARAVAGLDLRAGSLSLIRNFLASYRDVEDNDLPKTKGAK